MKANRKVAVVVTLACAAAAGQAQAQVYAEAAYLHLKTSSSTRYGTVQAEDQSAAGIVGYQLNETFSVEGMIGTGLTNADVKLNGATQTNPVAQKLDLGYGSYIRAKAAIGNDVGVFARVGRNAWKTTASNNTATVSTNLYDWMYSVGLSYDIDKSMYITGSWATVYNKSGTKTDGWSVGVGYRF